MCSIEKIRLIQTEQCHVLKGDISVISLKEEMKFGNHELLMPSPGITLLFYLKCRIDLIYEKTITVPLHTYLDYHCESSLNVALITLSLF